MYSIRGTGIKYGVVLDNITIFKKFIYEYE